MDNNPDLLIVVPARGGSKRLPGKNLMQMQGKPLIRWTLEAALDSQVSELIVVTSDDDAILAEGARSGVRTLKRPALLATDTASTFDVLIHVLDTLAEEGVRPKKLMLLQPTSPLREAVGIREAVQLMEDSQASSVISVCLCEHSPLWSNVLGAGGSMADFLRPELLNRRSQDLPDYYRLNGSIYLAKTEDFVREKGFFMANSVAYVMAAEQSIDIDNRIDFKICEALMAERVK
ncbi:acylneuraminate cytidylyltransferase family protein [Pseudomonas sp. MYb118]|uniref:acylneuraminate cytidylyltransferase family protein n=1 Tax=Pseudomonas sp. MYb118 TaxID=1848720 RepID=UPI0034CD1122